MAKLCECCGNKNNSFVEDPLYLTNDKILCQKCAAPIKIDMSNLYYVKTKEEYEALRNNILAKCKECFNDTITEYITIVMNKIYGRLSFLQQEKQATFVGSSTTVSSATKTETIYFENKTESSSGMFDNIGGKIKTLAQVVTWIGIIASVISGFAIMSIDEEIFVGLIVMIFGALMSWVSSFVLYGFGQLVENSDKLVKLSKK